MLIIKKLEWKYVLGVCILLCVGSKGEHITLPGLLMQERAQVPLLLQVLCSHDDIPLWLHHPWERYTCHPGVVPPVCHDHCHRGHE